MSIERTLHKKTFPIIGLRSGSQVSAASLYLQVVFYLIAGVNHFINPDFYLSLIPPYFTFPQLINYLSGSIEILLSVGLILHSTRKLAAYAIIAMLVAFIPSHVYFIQIGGCIEGGLCAPVWVGWVRLVVVHPLLMFWAWKHRK
ncbi:MAG: hypothetical protein AAGA66_01860 [Bacteroidota bacterium]